MRLIFLGSDPIALPVLDWLAGEGKGIAQVVGVFTGPDRPAGRGQQSRVNAIKGWAQTQGLPVYQPEKLTEADRDQVVALAADLCLVFAYGQILREAFIAAPRRATLNLHASLLPHYRGASPIQSAVAAGERRTGVSLMKIVRELDAGPVADQVEVPIGPLDTAREVEAAVAAACPALLARTLPRLARGELVFVEQVHAEASFCRRLRKEDGRLDWYAPAAALAARINGLFPWPACAIEVGGQRIKLGLAEAAEGEGPNSGEVVGQDDGGLLVQAGRGRVRLRRLQREGGRMLPAGDFLRGFPIPLGTRLASTAMAPLVGPRPLR
jgi:methionyl-tRNA formyltransferase